MPTATKPPASARTLAFDILRKVESGGYASDLLLERSAGLDSRDAGLATEIVFGVLRYRAQLDYLIALYSGRARKLDPEVRLALRMGIYQLRYLERVPAHAAVGDSVELVRRARKASAAGFVNAVLRQTDRDAVEWPSREIALSCPEWLLARWERRYGGAVAEAMARAALEEPGKYLPRRALPGYRLAIDRAAARNRARPAGAGRVRGAGQQNRAGGGGGSAGDRRATCTFTASRR